MRALRNHFRVVLGFALADFSFISVSCLPLDEAIEENEEEERVFGPTEI
jgi:hypothetical protein